MLLKYAYHPKKSTVRAAPLQIKRHFSQNYKKVNLCALIKEPQIVKSIMRKKNKGSYHNPDSNLYLQAKVMKIVFLLSEPWTDLTAIYTAN